MRLLFRYQDVNEVVEGEFQELPTGVADERKVEQRKKDNKALFLIHKCVDDAHFKKIQHAKTAREAWSILMLEGDRVKEYFDKVVTITNQMKGCGEVITDLMIDEQALKVHHGKSDTKKKQKKWKGKKGNWKACRPKDDQEDESNAVEGKGRSEKFQKKKDKRSIECFNCHKYGHYAYECYANKGKQKGQQDKKAYVAQENSDFEPLTLMVTTTAEGSSSQIES
ncbi:uncharacterized protein LOC108324424 [Vigna angularis]|uniref:uncharacterized protein LOC108324424 n=1 Tax=Phaseolus angularis TaxID=3914 RepID=UPI00080A5E0B|nr:uncharacterized protein LOC108324424 [Vigna angularis]